MGEYNFMDYKEEFWKYEIPKYEIPKYEPIIDDALSLQLGMPIFETEIQKQDKEMAIDLARKKSERSQITKYILELTKRITEKNLDKDLKNGFIAERICLEKYLNSYSNKDFIEDKTLEIQEMINTNDFKDDEMRAIFEKIVRSRRNELLLEKIESNFGTLRMKSGENVIDDGIKVTEYQGHFNELIQAFKDGKFEVFNERASEVNLKKILTSLEYENANKVNKPTKKSERDSWNEEIIYVPAKDLDTLNKLCRNIWQEMTELGIYNVNGDSYNIQSKKVDKVINKIYKLKELTKKDHHILREQMILELADYYPDVNIAEAIKTMKMDKVGCVDIMRMISDGKFDKELEISNHNENETENDVVNPNNLPIEKGSKLPDKSENNAKENKVVNFFKKSFAKIKNAFSRKKGISKELSNEDAKRYNELFKDNVSNANAENPWKVSEFEWKEVQLESDITIVEEKDNVVDVEEK